MTSPSIMVIDPSLNHPEVSSFNQMTNLSTISFNYHLPVMSDKSSMINSIEKACGIIILGSAASVHDNDDLQHKLREVLDKAIKLEIPTLGICFGHQFLAHHFNGKVDCLWKNEEKKGVREVKILPNRLLGQSSKGTLIYAHKEGVTKCPSNFDIIGSSHMINVEAIEHHTKPIWGFQTHIEASWSFAKRQGIEKEIYLRTRDFGLKILSKFFKYIEL